MLRDLGSQIKGRIVELTVEVEDADKALELLGSAMDKEARAHREEVDEIEARLSAEAKEVARQERDRLTQVLREADALVREKEAASALIKNAAKMAMETEACRVKRREALESDYKAALSKAKAQFDRGAAERRKKHLEAETQAIRAMTVKGLEPEVRRLVDAHADEMKKVEKEFERELDKMEIDAEIALRKLIDEKRFIFNEKRSEAEEKERRASDERLELLEKRHRESYQRGVQKRAEATATLRSEFARDLQRKQRESEIFVEQKRRGGEDKLHQVAGRMMQETQSLKELWQRAQSVVAAVQSDEDQLLEEDARREHEILVEEVARVEILKLREKRDRTIDERIRSIQERDFKREEAEKDQEASLRADLKAKHLEAAATSRAQRTEWVNQRAEALTQAKFLRDRLDHLKDRERTLKKEISRKEHELAPSRAKVETRRRQHEASLKKTQDAHAQTIAHVRADLVAATVALEAKKAQARRDDHRRQRHRDDLRATRDATLADRDAQVKSDLQALDHEILNIKEAIHLEQLRHTHLTKLLKNYSRVSARGGGRGASEENQSSSPEKRTTNSQTTTKAPRRAVASSSRANTAASSSSTRPRRAPPPPPPRRPTTMQEEAANNTSVDDKPSGDR